MKSVALDSNKVGHTKQPQTGSLTITVQGEERSFDFELKPQ